MQILKGALAILITLAIAGIGSAFAQDATNQLQPLVKHQRANWSLQNR